MKITKARTIVATMLLCFSCASSNAQEAQFTYSPKALGKSFSSEHSSHKRILINDLKSFKKVTLALYKTHFEYGDQPSSDALIAKLNTLLNAPQSLTLRYNTEEIILSQRYFVSDVNKLIEYAETLPKNTVFTDIADFWLRKTGKSNPAIERHLRRNQPERITARKIFPYLFVTSYLAERSPDKPRPRLVLPLSYTDFWRTFSSTEKTLIEHLLKPHTDPSVTTLQAFNSLVELIKKTKANPLIKGQGSNVVWELPLLSSIIGFCREGNSYTLARLRLPALRLTTDTAVDTSVKTAHRLSLANTSRLNQPSFLVISSI